MLSFLKMHPAKNNGLPAKAGRFIETFAKRPLLLPPKCVGGSGSNFKPRNIQYIPPVEIFAFLELESAKALWRKHFSKVSPRIYLPVSPAINLKLNIRNSIQSFLSLLETFQPVCKAIRLCDEIFGPQTVLSPNQVQRCNNGGTGV